MVQIQYEVTDKVTGKSIGWLIGKTNTGELMIQAGTRRFPLALTAENEAKYTITKYEMGSK